MMRHEHVINFSVYIFIPLCDANLIGTGSEVCNRMLFKSCHMNATASNETDR